jgi:hypothetical protein
MSIAITTFDYIISTSSKDTANFKLVKYKRAGKDAHPTRV